MKYLILIYSVMSLIIQKIGGSCMFLNYCNGHGKCIDETCQCFEGWGAASDFTTYRAPDCTARTCPSGFSWGDLIRADGTAHNLEECSGKGICNRVTGTCKCSTGFTGNACQRSKCPNDCSGHGQCMSMKRLAEHKDAYPLNVMSEHYYSKNTTIWDSEMISGCLCDSSWVVGLQANETQASEWFGPDCSQRHCPSGDDPKTVIDETDCYNISTLIREPLSVIAQVYGNAVGRKYNHCHIDCSNEGICDYKTGTCHCFRNHWGLNCGHSNHVRASEYNQEGIYFIDFTDVTVSGDMPEQGEEYVFGDVASAGQDTSAFSEE